LIGGTAFFKLERLSYLTLLVIHFMITTTATYILLFSLRILSLDDKVLLLIPFGLFLVIYGVVGCIRLRVLKTQINRFNNLLEIMRMSKKFVDDEKY